ncbi:hypothetical protein [Streptomyces anulatus]|uniref:hypothetical protein n=1 Tax=Streptomyces anulatus TaxID=1892 RepID=UPI002F915C9D
MAKLVRAVHVTDPKSGRRLVLGPGEEPAPHLAALVQNPAAWEDGKLPAVAEESSSTKDADTTEGVSSASEETADVTKPAARTTAANKPARGRKAAAEGTGGQ